MKSEVSSNQSLLFLLQQRIAEIKERVGSLQGQLDSSKTDLSAYEQVLVAEKKKAGVTEEDSNPDKWALFEQFCVSRAKDGFRRPEIAEFFRERGVAIGKNFPYYAVEQWADRLDEENGRFYYLNGAGKSTASA